MKNHVGGKRKTDVDDGAAEAEVPAKKVKTSSAKLPENKSGSAIKTTTGRPRGRPRKDASATPIFKSETSLSPSLPPKKRGRPAKPKPIEQETTIHPQPTPPAPTQPANHFGIPGQPFIPPSGDDIAILRNQFLHMERYQKQKAAEESAAKTNEGKLPNLVKGTFMQNERGFFVPAPGYEPFLSGCNGISGEAFLESLKTGEDPVVVERRFVGFRKAVFGGGGGLGGQGDVIAESVVGGIGRGSTEPRSGGRGGNNISHEPVVEPSVTKPWFGESARPVFASGNNSFRGRGGGIDDGNGLLSRSQSIFSGGSGSGSSRPLPTEGQTAPVNAGIMAGSNTFDHSVLFGNTRMSPGPAGAKAICPAFATKTRATNIFGGAGTSSSTVPWTDKLSKPFGACSTTHK